MTTMELLHRLTTMGVILSFEGDKLRCNAPTGVLTPALQREISEKKSELLLLLKKAQNKTLSKVPPLTRISRDQLLPLSFAQQRLWLLQQLDPDNKFYYTSMALQIKGPLVLSALEKSLLEMINRHEVLRTNFKIVNGKPFQCIQQVDTKIFKKYDLQLYSKGALEEQIKSIFLHITLDPYDFTHELLIRVALLQLSPDDHILLIGSHHIVTDGWSKQILVREFIALYEAACSGQPASLAPLPIQYADYAFWQQHYLQGEVLEEHLTYWRKHLEGMAPLLELPTDYPRPPVQSYRGGYTTFSVPASLTRELERVSREHEATLFMTLLAAFQVLLARLSGQQDIIVGSPIAHRTMQETENLIGFFVNTLVLRTNLAGDPSFEQVLQRVREVCLEAYVHQDLPFEKLVEELQPVRSLSHQPVFQVSFDLHNQHQEILSINELEFLDIDIDLDTEGSVNYDLEMNIDIASHGGLNVEVHFASDLFERNTIERWMQYFLRLLEEVVRSPQMAISQCSLLSDVEQHKILSDWNKTAMALPKTSFFPYLFEEQVQRTPDALAVVCDDLHISYADLFARSIHLAQTLRTLGVKAEERVGIFAPRSVDLLVGMLGIWQAGGVYIPIDPLYPTHRITGILQDAMLSVLLVHPSVKEHLPSYEGVVQWFDVANVDGMTDEAQKIFYKEQAVTKVVQTHGEQLAYMIYTSGSTGRPKGAMVTHRGMLNHLYAKITDLHLTTQDRLAQTANQGFDIAVWQLVAPLLVGGCVHVLNDEIVYAPSKLADAIDREAISIWEAVPQYLQTVLNDSAVLSHTFTQLRSVLMTADALPPTLCRQWLAQYPHALIINAYGPTECSDDVTHHTVATPPPPQRIQIPIGHPLINTQIYILDSALQPVPVRVRGELYVGGTGVGRGYFANPQKTASVFIPDPFSALPGARLYRTGDLARWLPDGTIEFMGRQDNQVKLRGFRIELGEIEATLLQHPHIQHCAVLALPSPSSQLMLVAYIVPIAQVKLSLAEVRDFLQSWLPEWMLPSMVVSLPTLPLNTNGKVDHKALPQPEWQTLREVYHPARIPQEALLLSIWEPILGITPIGIHDSFFEIGGHSLLAAQIIARVRDVFLVDVPLRMLFEAPTVASFAQRILQVQQAQQKGHQWTPLVPISLRGKSRPLFCVHPMGGSVYCYASLASSLDCSVIGVQSRGIDTNLPIPETIEEMAAEYVTSLTEQWKNDVYLLCGWSSGGVIAFEMSRQLQQMGKRIEFLGLFDTFPPSYPVNHMRSDSDMLLSFIEDIANSYGTQSTLENLFSDLSSDTRENIISNLSVHDHNSIFHFLQQKGILSEHLSLSQIQRYFEVYRMNSVSFQQYHPTIYPLQATLFLPQDGGAHAPESLQKWQQLTQGNCTMISMPGNHYSLMQSPHVQQLAAHISSQMERNLDGTSQRGTLQ